MWNPLEVFDPATLTDREARVLRWFGLGVVAIFVSAAAVFAIISDRIDSPGQVVQATGATPR